MPSLPLAGVRRSAVTSLSHTPPCAVVEIAVYGSWSRSLGLDVTTALRDCLAGRPGVVIVDLNGLADADAASLPLWLAARRAAAVLRPPARLALCLPAATVLHERLRRIGPNRLPVYPTMVEAHAAMANPSVRDDAATMPGNHERVITVGSRPPS